jgi:hypothetical protein
MDIRKFQTIEQRYGTFWRERLALVRDDFYSGAKLEAKPWGDACKLIAQHR